MNTLALALMQVLLRYHGHLPEHEIDHDSLKLVLGPALTDQ